MLLSAPHSSPMTTSFPLALLKVTCLKVTSSQITSFYVVLGNFILCSQRPASSAVHVSQTLRSGCFHLPDCDSLPRRGCSFLQQPPVTDPGPLQTLPSHNPPVACTLSCFSRVRLFATLWTVACQAAMSMAFSRQEYWSELPCLPSGDLSNPRIELASPALLHRQILPEPPGKPDLPVTGAQKSLLLARTPTIFPPWPHLSLCYCYFSFCQSTALTIFQAPFPKNLKGWSPISGPVGSQSQTWLSNWTVTITTGSWGSICPALVFAMMLVTASPALINRQNHPIPELASWHLNSAWLKVSYAGSGLWSRGGEKCWGQLRCGVLQDFRFPLCGEEGLAWGNAEGSLWL